MKTMNELKASPMLYLSGGSKELFHSNFLYWLGTNYRVVFQELMSKLCRINSSWPEGWTIRREYRHMDLCITYEKDTGKMRSGKPVVEECAFIIVENKVKSLPELTQLRRYEQAFINHDSGCTYVVLSLVKDFSGHKYLNENTCWQIHHYDELAQMIRDCCPDSIICQEHRPYIRDYCQYVSNLSMMAEEWRIDEHEPFLSQCDDLRELRLNDIYEKVRYAQVAMMLADKLRTVLVKNTEEERVVLGMSNTDVILRRGREDADEILSFYGCPEAKPFGQVFISSGMSHGVGLVEAKIKITEDCCLVIQVQGNHYCHAIERENIFEKTGKLSMLQLMFMNFGFGGLKERLAEADSEICHYKTGFVYRWQKVLPSHTVADIIDAMSTDIIEIMYQRGSV
jgi:hypothetical protein